LFLLAKRISSAAKNGYDRGYNFAARIFRHIGGTHPSACEFLFREFRSDAGVTAERRTGRNQRRLLELQQGQVKYIASSFSDRLVRAAAMSALLLMVDIGADIADVCEVPGTDIKQRSRK
jgi:hypothetical protein